MVEVEAVGTVFFAFKLLGEPDSLGQEDPYEVEGVEVIYRGAREYRGIEQPDVMKFLIGYAAGKTLDPFVETVVRYGKQYLQRLRIGGEEVPLEEADILEVLRKAQEDDPQDGSE